MARWTFCIFHKIIKEGILGRYISLTHIHMYTENKLINSF